MGLAFGILGFLTFASMFAVGYYSTKNTQLKDEIKTLKSVIKILKDEK